MGKTGRSGKSVSLAKPSAQGADKRTEKTIQQFGDKKNSGMPTKTASHSKSATSNESIIYQECRKYLLYRNDINFFIQIRDGVKCIAGE